MNNAYCSIGHISRKSDIDTLEQMLIHNYAVISKFNYIIVHQNSSDSTEQYLSDYNNIWKKVYGKDVIVIKSLKNRGHTFGYIDSDNAVVNVAKTLPIDFIYKGVNDILLDERLLDLDICDNFDFYFLQGIGYTGLTEFNYDIDKYMDIYITEKYLYPQTNFYIIRNSVDYIYDKKNADDAYNYCQSISTFNGKVWEYIPNFSCEKLLAECIFRNRFRYKHLMPDKSFMKLLSYIKDYKICDCSHKNIYIEDVGVCHYHSIDQHCLSI